MFSIPKEFILNRKPGDVLYPELNKDGLEFGVDYDIAGALVDCHLSSTGKAILVERVPLSPDQSAFLKQYVLLKERL